MSNHRIIFRELFDIHLLKEVKFEDISDIRYILTYHMLTDNFDNTVVDVLFGIKEGYRPVVFVNYFDNVHIVDYYFPFNINTARCLYIELRTQYNFKVGNVNMSYDDGLFKGAVLR